MAESNKAAAKDGDHHLKRLLEAQAALTQRVEELMMEFRQFTNYDGYNARLANRTPSRLISAL